MDRQGPWVCTSVVGSWCTGPYSMKTFHFGPTSREVQVPQYLSFSTHLPPLRPPLHLHKMERRGSTQSGVPLCNLSNSPFGSGRLFDFWMKGTDNRSQTLGCSFRWVKVVPSPTTVSFWRPLPDYLLGHRRGDWEVVLSCSFMVLLSPDSSFFLRWYPSLEHWTPVYRF